MEIVFSRSGKTLEWSDDYDSILELAEDNDIYPDYSRSRLSINLYF
jgi:hypothetical protein